MALHVETEVRDAHRGEEESSSQGLTWWLCFSPFQVCFPLKSLHSLNSAILRDRDVSYWADNTFIILLVSFH